MAKNTFDPNSPLIQASITSDGGNSWPVVDELGDPGMRSTTQRPDYPESEAVVHGQLDSDLGIWATNDSTIDDDDGRARTTCRCRNRTTHAEVNESR